MSCIIGIDPGKTGAFALLDSYGELLEVRDMPCVGKHVSIVDVARIFNDWTVGMLAFEPATCVIENVYSSPQMGVASAFSFGRSKGIVETGAAMSDCRIVYVTPAKWKRDMTLNKDKGKARQLAMERWPKHRDLFKRVKDDGRAEAALIGLWQVEHG